MTCPRTPTTFAACSPTTACSTEEMRSVTVAGVDALEWDATLGSSGAVRARTVVFERDGVAWRLQFADSSKAFDAHAGDLAQMLRSWQFR